MPVVTRQKASFLKAEAKRLIMVERANYWAEIQGEIKCLQLPQHTVCHPVAKLFKPCSKEWKEFVALYKHLRKIFKKHFSGLTRGLDGKVNFNNVPCEDLCPTFPAGDCEGGFRCFNPRCDGRCRRTFIEDLNRGLIIYITLP